MSTLRPARGAAAVLLFGAVLACMQTPPSGAAVLDRARADARSSGRAIFAIFHASW